MTAQLGTVAAGKLLVSIFNSMHNACGDLKIKENTQQIAREHMQNIGFDINLPIKIRLADDYAELFSHIMGEINDDDISNFAHNKAIHAANFGSRGYDSDEQKFHAVKLMSCDKKINTTKDIIDKMQQAQLIEVSKPFIPVVR